VTKKQHPAPAKPEAEAAADGPPSVGERILTTATDLFYREGVRAVGIQRVIDEAGIAKASLYAHYASKDDLVAACVAKQMDTCHTINDARLATPGLDARGKLLTLFDVRAEIISAPFFRGCVLLNSASELPDPHHPARVVVAEARAYLRELMTTLCKEAGVTTPADVAGMLLVLYDGAAAAALADGNPDAARHARRAAEEIIDAHIPTRTRVASRRRGLPTTLK